MFPKLYIGCFWDNLRDNIVVVVMTTILSFSKEVTFFEIIFDFYESPMSKTALPA